MSDRPATWEVARTVCRILGMDLAHVDDVYEQNWLEETFELQYQTTTASSNATEQWICNNCNEIWEEEGDDRWIVCDACNKQCHFQRSHVSYETVEDDTQY